MAFDQGTTSSRAILFDGDGRLVQVAQREFPQHVRAHEQTGVDGQTLDCSIVEHDPEDHFIREACVLEHYFHVSVHRETLFLLFAEQKNYSRLLRAVLFFSLKSKLLANVEAFAAVNFEEWNAAST